MSSGSSAASCSAAPIAARTFGPSWTTSKPGHPRRARGRRQQRRQHQHGRRLAGAVRARGSRRSRRESTCRSMPSTARSVLEVADELLDLDAVVALDIDLRYRRAPTGDPPASGEASWLASPITPRGSSGSLRRDDLPAVDRVGDVDRVVLAVGADDADEDRGPAPEAELALPSAAPLEQQRRRPSPRSRRPPPAAPR